MTSDFDICIYQCIATFCHRPVGTTQLVLSPLFVEHFLEQFLILLFMHEVMDLYFLFLVSAPGPVEIHDAIFLLLSELFFLEEFVLLVAVPEEESHGSALLAISLGYSSVLHHSSERSNACA